jgi:hypothetical protein
MQVIMSDVVGVDLSAPSTLVDALVQEVRQSRLITDRL